MGKTEITTVESGNVMEVSLWMTVSSFHESGKNASLMHNFFPQLAIS